MIGFIKKLSVIHLVLILVVLVAFVMIAIDDRLSTPDYTTTHAQAKQTLTLAIITDLHSCYYGEGQRELLDALHARKPDAILLGGDIYDDKLPFTHADTLLAKLGNITPNLYYVNGNHELYLPTSTYQQLEQRIKHYGIHIIHGKGMPIQINGKDSGINVYGVSDPVNDAQFWQDLNAVGNAANRQHLNILLAHRPEHISDYLHYPFDVIVSGHAHGGQWRLPYLVNGVFAPNQGFLPKYAGGQYHFDNPNSRSQHTQFIVSRGLAKESTRFIPRIFNRPELIFLTIPSGQ
ncbi:metallophosphoesterase [Moraxella sp.]|uniref:metallophosphoesterase n=1 Tax=Moraxella sp. TaxID=479 RepID=UPI0026DC4910|nr:metallophosphoesterase [Moraxella sp.]MDO4894967.1 metallophosphoesterase [Moraxella sp.]